MEKKRILIVDDEEKFARMVQVILEGTGKYEVRMEIRGKIAFQAARDFHPDLILLDIAMPDVDGAEVASQLREDQTLRNVPVVFLTAMVARSEVGPDSKIGGHPFIAKPVSAQELLQGIEKNLRK